MKFALLTVSYSGLFYDGPALSVVEQIRRAKRLGFDGLSIEAKRPVGSPLDLSPEDRTEIRDVAAREGIALCAVESMSNFASPFMEERENNLAMMKEVLTLAQDLQIDLVKVFAAWPGIIDDEDDTGIYGAYERGKHYKRLYPADLRRWNRAVAGIRQAADWAADRGLTLALQNHAPLIAPGYEDALMMVHEIERTNVKLCLDAPLFQERQSDDYIKEATEKCGDRIVLSHYGAWNVGLSPDGTPVQQLSPSFGGLINYPAYLRELERAGYDGFLVSEYCLPCIKNHQLAGIEDIDSANETALAYMKGLVATTAAAAGARPTLTHTTSMAASRATR
ncbi:MAG: TIM barrel protein [Luteitalea sp.]|nr:TIM barrel protein [Luteitalea sp.]